MTDLDRTLAALDPAASVPTLEPGTERFTRLLDAATGVTSRPATVRHPAARTGAPSHRLTRRRVLIGVAAASLLAVGGVVGASMLTPVSPAVAMGAAADRLAAATSGHLEGTWTYPDGSESTATADFAGAALRIDVTRQDPGQTRRTTSFIAVRDRTWQRLDGVWRLVRTGEPQYPFAQASAAVVRAVVAGDNITTSTDDSGGTTYTVVVDPPVQKALLALRPGELSWFELEHPQVDSRIAITVTDNGISKIAWEERRDDGPYSYSGRITDLGKPVVITAPTGS